MKRRTLSLTVLLALALGASAHAGAVRQPVAAQASRGAKIDLRRTSLGEILVSSSGVTLYEFTRDRGRNSCVKVSGCAEVWPALESSAKPVAGHGVRPSLLSTVAIPGGGEQVTYAGHPLYLYSGGGGTSYVGASSFGGTWDAVNAAGRAVR